jgi:crotonobetainyl-CoA:carnitine CoA-transferase CaiB-like acyl-CoA transferase
MLGLDAISGRAPTTDPDRPIFTYAPVGAYSAAQLAVQGTLAAIHERSSTGCGQVVTTSLLHGMTAGTMRFAFRREEGRNEVLQPNKERSLRHLGISLTFLTTECADGRYIQMCARQDHHFKNWLKALDLSELLDEERYKDAPLGFRSEGDLLEMEVRLREAMLTKSQAEWMRIFAEETDVGADPFLDSPEFLRHPQLLANERVAVVEDPTLGPITQLDRLALMPETALGPLRPAPALPTEDVAIGWGQPVYVAHSVESSGTAAKGASGPLSGITILEVAYFLAGPFGATLLAEMGARVIKVEPMEGDSYRRTGMEFVHMVHGKESICLDLKSLEGKSVLQALIRKSDVLLTSFRPGVPERLGLGVGDALAVNSQLVYLRAASYGTRGPQAHRAAMHSTPNALCGGGIKQGGRGNPPVDDSYPDPCSGIAVATAILLGLLGRDLHGHGQYIETTMLASAGYTMSNDLVHYASMSAQDAPDGDQLGLNPLYRLYRTLDGWLFLAVVQEHESKVFYKLIAPEAAGLGGLHSHPETLSATLEAVFATASTAHWIQRLRTAGLSVADADQDPYEEFLRRAGVLSPAAHPDYGAYWRLDPRVSFSGHERDRRPAAGLGEHTLSLLTELARSDEEIQAIVGDSVTYGTQGT